MTLAVLLVLFLFASLLFSLTGRQETWKFIMGNIAELKKRLGGAFLLSRVLEMTTNSFASEDTAKDIEVRYVVCVGGRRVVLMLCVGGRRVVLMLCVGGRRVVLMCVWGEESGVDVVCVWGGGEWC